MLEDYKDIRKRIKDPILWFDSNGVPRYDKFNPDMCPNIYADEVILMEIACQDCREKFNVEMHWSTSDKIFGRSSTSLSECIKSGNLPHYGDPPRHSRDEDDESYYCTGVTMNCEDIKVIEYWYRDESTKHDWKRDNTLEG